MSETGDVADDGPALVSGATGFIGAHLVRRLLGLGRRMVAVTRGTSDVAALRAAGVDVLVDPGDAAGLAAAVAEVRPATVFHLAAKFVALHAVGDVDALVASNLGFATRLVEAAVGAGCRRIVAAGTSWQVAANGEERPNSLYAATKAAFETILTHYAEADGAKVVTLRLYDTYGPGDVRRKLLPLLLSALSSGERLGLSPGEQRLDLVHVDDVVEAFLVAERRTAAGEAGRVERFAVRSGRAVSVRELVAILETVSGRAMPVTFGERPYRVGEVMAPAPGEILPGWRARIELEDGLSALIGG
ncbi:MAG: NAD(P)-dependent oxidoreductase [Hyphomicrobiales bacterium]|nr:NAD(P)-dependent oxidoreductase [Hyphomicrobiales bacterium]